VVIEKPFGRDLTSAKDLNRLLGEMLDESQVFRIDHYLGKETVQNILVFRFANSIFEPLWNSKYVDHVEITAAEELGVENRAKFYDETGVLRDMVQGHLMQVLGLVAMEPPPSFGAEDIRDEKSKIFRTLRPIAPDEVAQSVVVGQYKGYLQEKGVAPGSHTPTFVALKLLIDNWRWNGVPFYVRAGKRLARRMTEVSIHFKSVPFCLFKQDDICQRLEPNVLTIRIQPKEGIALGFECKMPGEDLSVSGVTMDFNYAGAFHQQPQEAYERLLLDCMRGNATLFARRDEVEQAWKLVTPVLEALEKAPHGRRRPRGSQGPVAARRQALDPAQVSVFVAQNPEALSERAADRLASLVAEEVARSGTCAVALSGGSTPGPILRRLAGASIPWPAVRWYFADERCVPPDDPESNYRGAREALFDRAPIAPEHVFRMEGEREDREQAALDYARKLPERIHLALLGIGEDGHFASVFPGSPLVNEQVRRVAAVQDSPKPPPWRLTLTPAGFRGTRGLMVAAGAGKARAVRRALQGDEPANDIPSRIWRAHEWVLDQAAASELET
jgi:6-phosphogluconolactonase